MRRLASATALVFFLGAELAGATAAVNQTGAPAVASAPAPDPRGDDEIRLRQVFPSHLPNTMRESDLRLWIHPHLGGLRGHDYMRMTTGLRYGVTRWWEVGASTDLYFSHGLGDVRLGKEYGAANFEATTKVNLGRRVLSGWDTAVGAEFEFPLGRPPAEVTDGLRHHAPWATFSRRLESRPSVRIFWGFGADFIERTSIAGTYGRNQFLNSNGRVSGGFVLDRQRLHYTFETSLTTNRVFSSGDDDVIAVRPGIVWEIPPKNDPKGKSNWVIGTGLNVQFGPNGTSLGGSLRLRYNLDLKSLLFRSN